MLGAIVGDIVGSVYEYHAVLGGERPLLAPGSTYTDETVLTVAVADSILHQRPYADTLREWAVANPGRRYSTRFQKWLVDPEHTLPLSYSNGAAGRVSPVGWAFDTLDETLEEARRSAEPTHSHPDGVAGAQAVAAAIFLARTDASKQEIRDELESRFGYDLHRSLLDCTGGWFEAAELSVPEAIICFLESTDVASSLQHAVDLLGDADSQAAIAGSITEAFYRGVPADLAAPCLAVLPEQFRSIVDEFRTRFHLP